MLTLPPPFQPPLQPPPVQLPPLPPPPLPLPPPLLPESPESPRSAHWHPCVFEGCDKRDSEAAHTLSEEYMIDSVEHWQTCTVCGHETDKTAHSAAGAYGHDETNHWETCICGQKLPYGLIPRMVLMYRYAAGVYHLRAFFDKVNHGDGKITSGTLTLAEGFNATKVTLPDAAVTIVTEGRSRIGELAPGGGGSGPQKTALTFSGTGLLSVDKRMEFSGVPVGGIISIGAAQIQLPRRVQQLLAVVAVGFRGRASGVAFYHRHHESGGGSDSDQQLSLYRVRGVLYIKF